MDFIMTLFTSPGAAAAVFAFLGIALTKFVEARLNSRKEKQEQEKADREGKKDDQDFGTQFRGELREEIKILRDELRRAEKDSDEWRGKYYEVFQQFITVKAELEAALNKIKEAEQLAKTIGD